MSEDIITKLEKAIESLVEQEKKILGEAHKIIMDSKWIFEKECDMDSYHIALHTAYNRCKNAIKGHEIFIEQMKELNREAKQQYKA